MKKQSLLSFSAYSKGLLCVLMILLPIWGVMVAQLGYYIGWRDAFTSIRYLIVMLLMFFLFVMVVLNLYQVKVTWWTGILTVYALYTLMHFVGSAGFELFVEGLRHEIIFTLLAWMVLLCSTVKESDKFVPSFQVFIFILFLNGLVAALFAVWQYHDFYILEVLYRVPAHEISNVHLAAGERLTSTLVNPINFGAFMALLFFAGASLRTARWQVVLLFLFSTSLIIGSMSRLALIAHLGTLLVVYGYGKNKLWSLFFFLLFAVSFFSVIYFGEDISSYDARFARMYTILEVSTFEDNARVNSWYAALKDMSFIEIFWGKGAGASSPTVEFGMLSGAVVIENSFLTIYYQYGLIGLILFLILALRFLYNAIVIRGHDEVVGFFLMGFVVVFIVMSLGNDFVRNLPFSFYFWILYAMSEIKMKQILAVSV